MATFLRKTPNQTADEALQLYLWDRDVAVALLADLAVLEVALRDALHDAATQEWGTYWYEVMPLDNRSQDALAEAWSRLPEHLRKNPRRSDLPGRLVANCMFGFWTNLLDQGGYSGKGPRRHQVVYDQNWQALRKAFPGGRKEAARQRTANPANAQQINFSRSWVHQVCKRINDVRNRVAHHEPVINGFPLKGQSKNGATKRLSIDEAHEDMLSLARMLDKDLAKWLLDNSSIPGVNSQRPF